MTDPIEALAYKFAIKIKEWNPELKEDVEDIRPGAAYYLNVYAVIIVSLLIGWGTGAFLNTALSLISFWYLRKYTGGFHLPTLTACAIFTTGLLSSLPHIPLDEEAARILELMTFILVLMFGAHKMGSLSNRTKNKLIAIALILINTLLLESPVVTLAFFAQSVTLILQRR